MPDVPTESLSRRTFLRGAACSVPLIGAALAVPAAPAEPGADSCADPAGLVDDCAVQLPEEFSWTSFSTTAVAGGTNYSILFNTRITPGPPVPAAATGYRIDSLNIAGRKRDGTPFLLAPSIGERDPRPIWVRSDSSLGFVLDVPWTAGQLVRSFDYTYNVVYLNGVSEIQTCTYRTAIKLAENEMLAGGVGSVTFSPPRLASCAG